MYITISIARQELEFIDAEQQRHVFSVSTALNGPHQEEGSGGTPLGEHRVRAKIGAGMPSGAVFVGRRFTGEVYSPALAAQYPQRDWILTRILWLAGNEPGYNQGGNVDTMRRYIYIHGTPDTEPMGKPYSHGCIRMRNEDVMWLFDHVAPYCPVKIVL
ncbi:MAG TPA: L,D-transpeptidase [Alcanivoracaceae bacterium]|nr:L,D-transpeptidase [Alcanivoracaceae bacterium]